MRPKKKTSEMLPIISSTHIMEEKSRTIFEAAIKPWMITNWYEKDYGIDANVEISRSISSSKDQIATGKRFSLQLKSSEQDKFSKSTISFSVDKNKLLYWYGSIEPVLLAYVNLNAEIVYYRWIDEDLISELNKQNQNWIAQENVTIKFQADHLLNNSTLKEIEKYVLHWKRPTKTILTPGNYFKYSKELREISGRIILAAQKYGDNALIEESQSLATEISRSLYTIAIVGPSRVGKSTLINALLNKNISPVGVLPTTGIPISIFPSDQNQSIIFFKDGNVLKGSIDAEFLNQYTSQKGNSKNTKGVKLVTVNLINLMLEKGLGLCDIPGLDDPDEQIQSTTVSALYHVNAIIYLISVASYLNGEFSFTNQIITDLTKLGGRMERVFLVFNKIDALSETQLNDVKEYINQQLKDYDIESFLPCPPIYLSSKSALENRLISPSNEDSVTALENVVWQFLLSNSKTGLHKILSGLGGCKSLNKRYITIENAKLLDFENKRRLETEVSNIQNELMELNSFVNAQKENISLGVNQFTKNSFANILRHLERELTSIPIDKDLPERIRITQHLEHHAYNVISKVNEHFKEQISQLQYKVNDWVSGKLRQVEVSIANEEESISLNTLDVSKYTSQIFSFFEDSQSGYLGILETILNAIKDFVENAVEKIAEFFIDDTKLRQDQIKLIVDKASRSYQKIENDLLNVLGGNFTKICTKMVLKTNERSNIYLGELRKQLSDLQHTLSEKEKETSNLFIKELNEIDNAIDSALIYLTDYTENIDWTRK